MGQYGVPDLIKSLVKTGLRPDEVRRMTPRDTRRWIAGWNESQSDGMEAPEMSKDTYNELVARYA